MLPQTPAMIMLVEPGGNMAASRVSTFDALSAPSIRPPAADDPANIGLGATQPIDITASVEATPLSTLHEDEPV